MPVFEVDNDANLSHHGRLMSRCDEGFANKTSQSHGSIAVGNYRCHPQRQVISSQTLDSALAQSDTTGLPSGPVI